MEPIHSERPVPVDSRSRDFTGFEESEDPQVSSPPEDPHAPEARLPIAAAPFLLFFRPGLYFRHFGRRPNIVLVLFFAWLFGTANAVDRVDSSLASNPIGSSWSAYWTALAFAGALLGIVSFAIGGWWYRLRIRWSGDASSDPTEARWTYLSAGQVLAWPLLGVAWWQSTRFATPLQAQASMGLEYLLILPFFFWSVVTSYRGVGAMFDVGRVCATWWFLILPMSFYGLLIGGGLWIALASPSAFAARAAVGAPQVYQGPAFTIRYPGNWLLSDDPAQFDELSLLTFVPQEDAFVEVGGTLSRSTPEALADSLLADYSQNDIVERARPVRVAHRPGAVGRGMRIKFEGVVYDVRAVVVPADDRDPDIGAPGRIWMLTFSREEDRDRMREAIELMESSMVLDASVLRRPDTRNPQARRGAFVSLDYPGNWTLSMAYKPDPATEIVEIVAPIAASVSIEIYPTTSSERQEIDATFDQFRDRSAYSELATFDTFAGLAGLGSEVSYLENADEYRFRVFCRKIDDERMVEVRFLTLADDLPLAEPGFRLIESTLRIDPGDAE